MHACTKAFFRSDRMCCAKKKSTTSSPKVRPPIVTTNKSCRHRHASCLETKPRPTPTKTEDTTHSTNTQTVVIYHTIPRSGAQPPPPPPPLPAAAATAPTIIKAQQFFHVSSIHTRKNTVETKGKTEIIPAHPKHTQGCTVSSIIVIAKRQTRPPKTYIPGTIYIYIYTIPQRVLHLQQNNRNKGLPCWVYSRRKKTIKRLSAVKSTQQQHDRRSYDNTPREVATKRPTGLGLPHLFLPSTTTASTTCSSRHKCKKKNENTSTLLGRYTAQFCFLAQ